MEICYLAQGQQLYRVAGRDYLVSGGELFVTFPNEYHDTGHEPTMPGELYWLQIQLGPAATFGLQRPTLIRNKLRDLPIRHMPSLSDFDREVRQIHQLLQQQQSGLLEIRIPVSIVRLLLLLIESAETPLSTSTSTCINTAIQYIESHLDRPLSLAEIAEAAFLSESWFKARFRREVGMPPGEYVLRRRMQRARRMLRDGSHSVTAVAHAMGFSSSQYFATSYRRVMGTFPHAERDGVNRGARNQRDDSRR